MIRQYEAMFLVSPVHAEGDKALEPVKRVLDRAGAEVLVIKKWDERKLAFEVRRQKRGVYVLVYFKGDGNRIADIERDVQLSEDLLRVMVIQNDDVTREQMEKPTPSETGNSPQVELAAPREDGFGPRRPRESREPREPREPRRDEEAPSFDDADIK